MVRTIGPRLRSLGIRLLLALVLAATLLRLVFLHVTARNGLLGPVLELDDELLDLFVEVRVVLACGAHDGHGFTLIRAHVPSYENTTTLWAQWWRRATDSISRGLSRGDHHLSGVRPAALATTWIASAYSHSMVAMADRSMSAMSGSE